MSDFRNKIQSLMNEFYNEWQKDENKGKSKWDVLNNLSEAHQIAVAFGNFNYQVENGGLSQWIYNGFFHDDSEKLSKYLESSTGLDERCQRILDTINKLDQYAQDTDCDRDGYYIDPDDEDSENQFIGDMIDCDGFDTWYYEHCGQDDWWKTVCGVIETVAGHDFADVQQEQPTTILSPAQKSLDEPDMFDSPDVSALRDRLIERLDENLAAYKAKTLRLGKSELYDSALEIATVQQAYDYFRNEHRFTTGQAEFLLKLENPLELLSDRLPLGTEHKSDVAEYIFGEANQEWVLSCGIYDLVSDDPETPPTTVSTQEKGIKAVGLGAGAGVGEKPSVIDEIRQSQKEARERPPIPKEQPTREKAARKKSEPDL